ncbi:hypothetical protein Bbelb_043720 [Branchiostoma belcheri]|nr:hypothetical protein Bbelb_043720 [Branchiostoma belcheri]
MTLCAGTAVCQDTSEVILTVPHIGTPRRPSPSSEDVIEESFRLYMEKEPAAELSPGTSVNNEGYRSNNNTEVSQSTSGYQLISMTAWNFCLLADDDLEWNGLI